MIDFDIAGQQGQRLYPDGFNVELKDGKRHAEARAGKPLQFSHDWYSLAEVMRLHTCREDVEGWIQASEWMDKRGGRWVGGRFPIGRHVDRWRDA